VALGTPSGREMTQWYFQRYIPHLPAAGEIVLFDRSWYNRAGVERAMGFCTDEQYWEFMHTCPELERMLVRDGIILHSEATWYTVESDDKRRAPQLHLTHPRHDRLRGRAARADRVAGSAGARGLTVGARSELPSHSDG
jgi:polyphosphate kinase